MNANAESSLTLDKSVTSAHILKFAIISLIGGFLFLVPIPYNGSITIPLGIVINWVKAFLIVGDFNIAYFLVLVFITVSTLGSIVGFLFKPGFIMNNEKLKHLFLVGPLYFVSKIVGCIVIWLVYFKVGPDMIKSGATGGSMMDVSGTLISVILAISFTMPLLTDFGIMEFTGVLIRKVVRPLFTCPGRSAIDLMTSWFGASNAAVLLTKRQYDNGYYSGREAAVITTNFSLVSIPFCYVIAELCGVEAHFTIWYVFICVTGALLAMTTPRIWPLRQIPDTYDETAGKQINESVPEGISLGKWALNQAGKRAQTGSAKGVVKAGLDIYLSVFMDLIPLVMAWGTIALILVEYTPIFKILAMPIGLLLGVLGIPDAMAVAPTMLVGFADMYIPALMLSGVQDISTRFILGAVSLVQIIYMTEVGAIIVKSKIPLGVGKLFVIFIERTVLSLIIITILTKVFMNF